MREILFRAKSGNEWVYGDLVHLFGNDNIAIHHAEHEGETRNYIDIIPETVGQYTGLTDKNGKKIFEGDIVKRFWLGMEIIYKITYESKHACFIGKAINTSGFTTFDNDGKKYEIIGNIYDNPELLKGGAE